MADMRERLIELINTDMSGCDGDYAEEMADYFIENGVIVLPCKVGDTLYVLLNRIKEIDECKVIGFMCGRENDTIQFLDGSIYTLWDRKYDEHFGKTIFFTREEAEQALQALKERKR